MKTCMTTKPFNGTFRTLRFYRLSDTHLHESRYVLNPNSTPVLTLEMSQEYPPDTSEVIIYQLPGWPPTLFNRGTGETKELTPVYPSVVSKDIIGYLELS